MDFIQKIVEKGGDVYLVGGTIRDRYYNKYFGTFIAPKDYDLLICKLDIDTLEEILKNFGTVKEVGKAFGIITFKPNTPSLSQHDIDIALPRKEKSTGPGYRDFEIISDPFIPIHDDLQRRDITVNAIAYKLHSTKNMIDPVIDDNNVVDLFNGRQDLQNKIVKAVGDPYKRLLEDPTRIMRALRQSSQFCMTLDDNLHKAIVEHYDLLQIIIKSSPVRVAEELTRLLETRTCYNVIEYMFRETNIFSLLDINLSSDEIDDLMKSLKYASDSNMPVRIKFSILLQHSNIKEWVKKYELSAAPHFPKKDIKFLLMSQIGMNMLKTAWDEDTEYYRSIVVRKMIQIVDKNRDQDLKDYYLLGTCFDFRDSDVYDWLKHDENIVRTTAEVKLGGNVLQDKYNFKGKEIGVIKQWLFDEITDKKVCNDTDLLEMHLKSYLKI